MKEVNQHSEFQKLREMIQDIHFAMFTTMDEKGQLRSRPMVTQEMDENGDLWFFTSLSSPKVEEVTTLRQVNLVYSTGDHRFVSVSGEAEVIQDTRKVKELWNLAVKTWFPKGAEDPDLVLIRVRPMQAEYWDASSKTFVQLFGLAKAIISGKKPDQENTEHRKIAL